MTAHIVVPEGGTEGQICVMGGHTSGWSLYLKDSKPAYCYNLAGASLTYLRGPEPLEPGEHTITYEFENSDEGFDAGGNARLYVDKKQVAEGEIARTAAFVYSLDETFDVGCDKSSPVTED